MTIENPKFIAVSPSRSGFGGSFGTGNTVDEAKSNCKLHGGNLNRVVAYELPDGITDPFVDGFGNVSWTWVSEQAQKDWYAKPAEDRVLPMAYRRGVS